MTRHHFASVESTNDVLRELAEQGAPEGTLVTADTQTSGRGRGSNTWSSPPGNLYLSVLLRPNVAARTLPALAPAVGLAVAEALATFEVDSELKWPNDVWIGGKKVAGVLVESKLAGRSVRYAIIGVGINVATFPEAIVATSLSTELGRPIDPGDVLDRVLDQITEVSATFVTHGFGALVDRWNARHARHGQQVRVDTPLGIVEGKAIGVDATGTLIVE